LVDKVRSGAPVSTPHFTSILESAMEQDPRWQLLVISLISSLVMLDSNVVAVALPTIARSLSADFADVQWVITAYVLPFAALLLAAGSFGDRVGRRRAVLIGLGVFGLSSLGCGLALSPTMLNIARAVQGGGASLVLTASLALINHNFAGAQRARAFAFWGASLGIAITCGPIIGGIITSTVGWTWAFLINVPICTALFIAALRLIPESRDPEAISLDYAGIASFSSGLFFVTWAVIDGNGLGWLSGPIVARMLGGTVLLLCFYVIESRQSRPMLDFTIFKSQHFIGTVWAMIGYAAGAQVMIFYLPLYLQNAFGFSPMGAGLAMLPFALPMFVVPRLSVHLHWMPRQVLGVGLAVSTAANTTMAWLASAHASYGMFGVAMTLAGIGAGMLNGETAKALQGALPANRAGVASGIGSTTRFVALLFSVAGLGALLVGVTSSRFALAAARKGLPASKAAFVAKRFAAGDVGGAMALIPEAMRRALGRMLQDAFQSGFSTAALAAAGMALACLCLTWTLMKGRTADANGATDAVFVAGE
jgi:EmrB/QacA subfamily drug resistance transporter